MQITLDLDDVTAPLLATLDDQGSVEGTIYRLIDHAANGVYRPGSWERPWLCQAFGEDFLDHLEPGDPYGRAGMDSLFERPETSLTPISPAPPPERTLILRRIRAAAGPISFSYLVDYAQSVGFDDANLAEITTDLIHLGHVGLVDEGHQSGFSFKAL